MLSIKDTIRGMNLTKEKLEETIEKVKIAIVKMKETQKQIPTVQLEKDINIYEEYLSALKQIKQEEEGL